MPADCEVAIIGAGPVGLLLANLLGARGIQTVVYEKRLEPPRHSQAIGITPPSLVLLEQLGLAETCLEQGVQMRECFVHGDSNLAGSCSFRELPGSYPFILSLPQQLHVQILEKNLLKFPSVTLHRGTEIADVSQNSDQVLIQHENTVTTSHYLVACDGWRSGLRERLKIRTQSRHYHCHFLMGDFRDNGMLHEEAHVFFTKTGAVESFPLPDGVRRWIVQVEQPCAETSEGVLVSLVQARTGHRLSGKDQLNQSAFTPRRLDCETLLAGRILLCGDAAHVMSPIGGQGMNTGYGDVAQLATALRLILRENQPPEPLLTAYDQQRRLAASHAATRAAWGMWLGTRTGKWQSRCRELLMAKVFLRGNIGKALSRHYAMV